MSSALTRSTTGLHRTASTRSSRASARAAKADTENDENDKIISTATPTQIVKEATLSKTGRGKKGGSKCNMDLKDSFSSMANIKSVISTTHTATSPSTMSVAILNSDDVTAPAYCAQRPPLSPSKSATAPRLPLSPTKRANGTVLVSTSNGGSPPKIMRNDENVSVVGKMKGLQSPVKASVRGGQSPARARPVMSPTGKKPLRSGCNPPSPFKSPLRTSCHPSSPLKSPPPLRLAMSPTRPVLTGSPVKPAPSLSAVKKGLFSEHNNDKENKSVPKPRLLEIEKSLLSMEQARKAMSPQTPKQSVTENHSAKPMSLPSNTKPTSTSPTKPLISPAKPQPAGSPASPPKLVPPLPTSPPTSPPENRLARMNLNSAPSPYAAARKAFHTATPAGDLKGREAERKEIVDYIQDHIANATSGALYVSGAPGTGKTATLNAIIQEFKLSSKCMTIYINCMSVRNSSLIYSKILTEASNTTAKGGWKGAQKAGEKLVTTKGKPILLFLDEMDQLGDAANQDVLYTLFEWTFLSGSRLVLVGVANALDLTDRILPRLQAKAGRKPRTLNFAPYSQTQLLDILSHRLSSSIPADSPGSQSLVDKSALLFCAKKVAAVSGDARKALDACRYAVEMVEKSSAASTPTTPVPTPLGTPSTASTPGSAPKKVGISHVMKVLSGVYENAALAASAPSSPATTATSSGGGTLTLQQKIIICCLVLMHKKSKTSKVTTVGKLQDVYKKVCRWKGFVAGMCEGGGDQAEFLSILANVEASGILTIKKEKVGRESKVNLLLDEKELEKALQDDRKMLASILQSDII